MAGEPDIFNLSFNAFMSFVSDCDLVSKRNPFGDFQIIWSAVNAPDESITELDRHNASTALNRQEWLQVLVRCAMLMYVPKGSAADVSDALDKILSDDLLPNLPLAALQDSNFFRRNLCYLQKVSNVLEGSAGSLKVLYEK